MTIDVTFAENAMEIRPQFKEVIQLGTGSDGATFIPNVSEEGILSWTNNGNLPNPEPVSIVGKDGYTPQKGVDYFTDGDKEEMIAQITPEEIGAMSHRELEIKLEGYTTREEVDAKINDDVPPVVTENFFVRFPLFKSGQWLVAESTTSAVNFEPSTDDYATIMEAWATIPYYFSSEEMTACIPLPFEAPADTTHVQITLQNRSVAIVPYAYTISHDSQTGESMLTIELESDTFTPDPDAGDNVVLSLHVVSVI